MPGNTKERQLLRNPQADALRETCIREAERVSAAIGHHFAHQGSVTDWAYVRGVWRMTFTWLLPAPGKARLEPGEEAAENRGFSICLVRGGCEVVVRRPGCRVTHDTTGHIATAELAKTLNLGFGIS